MTDDSLLVEMFLPQERADRVTEHEFHGVNPHDKSLPHFVKQLRLNGTRKLKD